MEWDSEDVYQIRDLTTTREAGSVNICVLVKGTRKRDQDLSFQSQQTCLR